MKRISHCLARVIFFCQIILPYSLTYANTVTDYYFHAKSTVQTFYANKPWWINPLFTLSGGAAFTKVGQSQSLGMANDYTAYQYSPNNNYNSFSLFGGFIGTEIPVLPEASIDVGLGYYQPASLLLGNGVLTQGVGPSSNDQFAYSYSVISRQLLVESKLLWRIQAFYRPYIYVGLGLAHNTAKNYSTNVPPFYTFTPQFTQSAISSFTYSVGAGFDINFDKNWRIGVGYRFSDLGKAHLGQGYIDTVKFIPILVQNHLYTHEVLAQLSYLI